MIAIEDESVGRWVRCSTHGAVPNTLVIFTSTTGGGRLRARGSGRRACSDNAPLRAAGHAVRGRHPSARHHPLAGTIAAKTQCGQANNSGTYIPRWQLARARLRSTRGRDHYVAMLTGPARPLDREAIFWHFPGYRGAGPTLLRTAPVSAVRMRRLKAAGVPGDGRQSCTTRADIGESATGAGDMPDTTRSCRRSSMAGASRLRLTMPTRNEDRRENTEPRKRGGEQSNDGGRGDA